MHRFFVPAELLANLAAANNSLITLPDKLAHQVRDVLRLGSGEQLVLLDNSGDEVLASVVKSNRAGVEVQVLERRAGKSESPVRIILCQGLLKSARFEWVLEKGTELGVAAFAPILCHRSMAGFEDAGPGEQQTWGGILPEATGQTGPPGPPQTPPHNPPTDAPHRHPPR